jgi:transposase
MTEGRPNAITLFMPKPYSYDLRHNVIQAIKLDGLKISEASIIFNNWVWSVKKEC